MLQLSQLGDQRRDRGGFDAVDRQIEVEHLPVGEVAVLRVQLGPTVAKRRGEREIAPYPFFAAFDRDIDPLRQPASPGRLVVDDPRRLAEAQPPQQAERRSGQATVIVDDEATGRSWLAERVDV